MENHIIFYRFSEILSMGQLLILSMGTSTELLCMLAHTLWLGF